MRRILLLIPTTSYRTAAFIEAAHKLNIAITVASDHKSTLSKYNPDGFLQLDIHDIQRSVDAAHAFSKSCPIDAVVSVDDQSVIAVAAISEDLDLPRNTIISVSAARNKYIMREFLAQHNVRQPSYIRLSLNEIPHHLNDIVTFPAVVKPMTLSGSRGVVRVNTPDELKSAIPRIQKIIEDASKSRSRQDTGSILIEEYIDGDEVAVEGILENGKCRVLAVFDKPDRLCGPYFEETIYITPSRHSAELQKTFEKVINEAASALGLMRGPVHCELRFNEKGVYVIEIAARSIGGYCSEVLRFIDEAEKDRIISLEEVILRAALGDSIDSVRRESASSGVMMIPVPGKGILQNIEGKEEASSVPKITNIIISARKGEELIPLPEGGKYPGFIFARSNTPGEVESALRAAHKKLKFIMG